MNTSFKYLSFMFVVFLLFSCQDGLVPDNANESLSKTYLKGTIYYKGGINKFPDSTQCFGIFVAAFKTYPEDSTGIISAILEGKVYLKFESQPYPVDSSNFEIEITDAPVNLEYIVVSMQIDSLKVDAQKAIGVYTLTGDNTKPSPVYMNKGDSTRIKLFVDFDNLPPQPFKQ